MSSNLSGTVHLVAIYQASQAIYDQFDKAVVLYEGRQIYFGPCGEAKQYFIDMGWECPKRQTTGDFLTSVTNPSERKAREGFQGKLPRTPDDFEKYWKESPHYKALKEERDDHEEEFPMGYVNSPSLFISVFSRLPTVNTLLDYLKISRDTQNMLWKGKKCLRF
jgi:ABC-type multidrug transport system ATPase subunit